MKQRQFRLVGAGAIVLALAITLGAMFLREARHVLATPINSWTEDINADCAVVLTGGANRIRDGFDLLSRHAVRKLIISGVNQQSELIDIFPQWPFYGQLNSDDVVLEKRSQTTYGNAQQSWPLTEALKCKDVVLITSRLHMYRALQTYRAQYPPDFKIYPRAILGGTPDQSRAEMVIESIKSLFYSLWAY